MTQKAFLNQVVIQLRHFREARGVSQVEISNQLNIGTRSYQRYETGESIPSIDLLFQLSKILDFNLKDFFSPGEVINSYHNIKIADRIEHVEPGHLMSYPLELLNTADFKEVIDSDDIKNILNVKIFVHSNGPMALSNPKNTFLNRKAREILGLENESVPTQNLTGNIAEMGLLWAALIQRQSRFVDHISRIHAPKGRYEIRSLSIFFPGPKQYYLLRNLTLNKIADEVSGDQI